MHMKRFHFGHILYFISVVVLALYIILGGLINIDRLELTEKLNDPTSPEARDTSRIEKDGRIFFNKYAREVTENSKIVKDYYPIFLNSSKSLTFIITCSAFGIIGTIIFLLVTILFRGKSYQWAELSGLVLLGCLMGLTAYIILKYLPVVLYKETSDVVPTSSYVIALLAGLSTESFFNKISGYLNR